MLAKQIKRIKRHKRVTAKVIGNGQVPRLCVAKSNQFIYAQLIDDGEGKTLVAVSGKDIKKLGKGVKKEKDQEAMTAGVALAYEVGQLIAKKAQEQKISRAVFDRGGYQYHGQVKALADGAREGGLKF
jgi:large subunit ribosomal protein L18